MDTNEHKPQETAGREEFMNPIPVNTKEALKNTTEQVEEVLLDTSGKTENIQGNTIENEAKIEKNNVSLSEDVSTANEANEELSVEEKVEKSHLSEEEEETIKEIEAENAEDAEDAENEKRHVIPLLDYHSMPMENLVGELQRLVKNEKVQAINKHVNQIRNEFNEKFKQLFEEKKEDFIQNGGNEIDFRYNSVAKRQFNEVYTEYREKRDQYYKNLEKSLKQNLENRLAIIEELKGLVNVEEDMNTTYNHFKEIQERWRNAGAIPRANYNDVWRTYHHHVEIFYDFLHLNRELRDLDFKHNLEEKTKLVERAERLAEEPDLGKAFRELQTLHKLWKEEVGPVGKEDREVIWERFSNATKVLHQRRKEHWALLDATYEKNLEKKNVIIAAIREVAGKISDNHKGLQKQIKIIESLKDDFFKAGKVPQKYNEATWAAFKEATRSFNRNKNAYYKGLKQNQNENLEKKRALLARALELKDSDDFDTATPEMKRIQSEWKAIGHVPRKYSDKIWKEFKDACNDYFDRIHAKRNESEKEEYANLDLKNKVLDRLKEFSLSGDNKKDVETLKGLIKEWKKIGYIPHNKRHINGKFNKIVDAIFKKLDINRHEAELLKYGDRIKQLSTDDNTNSIDRERSFIRKRIDESKAEIRQLENNLQFFSNADQNNPLVRDVIKNINKQKDALETWKEKLKKINILENSLTKEQENVESEPTEKEG